MFPDPMIASVPSRRRLPVLIASLIAFALPAGAHACRTLVVTKAKVAYAHSRTIQAAVSEAKPCDWILVAPGVYRGSVVCESRWVGPSGAVARVVSSVWFVTPQASGRLCVPCE